jgi:hypothetical protein
MSNVKYQEVMNDNIKQNKVALQILQQKDADNVPKYWIGQYGSEQKLSMSDVIQAMEEYASARTKELEDQLQRLKEKWEDKLALHRRVCDDALMYTKGDRLKHSHYAQAVSAFLSDVKAISPSTNEKE